MAPGAVGLPCLYHFSFKKVVGVLNPYIELNNDVTQLVLQVLAFLISEFPMLALFRLSTRLLEWTDSH